MSFFDKLKHVFNDRQGEAERRVSKLIAQQCDWMMVESLIFPEKGVGPRISAVLDAIIESKNWKLLGPLVERAGDWMDTINLVYRPGEFGAVAPARAQELEDIYQAVSKARRNSAKVLEALVSCTENWACQHNNEACFDWAKSKPEFVPLPALGLAALCDQPIDGNPLAMKVIATKADIERAIDAVDWIYSGTDRDIALDNLAEWGKKLDARNNKPNPPAPKAPGP